MTEANVLLAHNRPVPRYTSFPTVPHWHLGPSEQALPALMSALDEPAEIYVHVPFCRRQCLYCGCNMVVSRRQASGDRWLDALQGQLEAFPDFEAETLHLGGGTPTWLDPGQLERLISLFTSRFGELVMSVEADPETLDDERLAALHAFERLSLGVQSFDPGVVKATGRDQRAEAVIHAARRARSLGIEQLNIDLMYGLPEQTPATFTQTLAKTVSMSPDRIAVFGYAHVPKMKPHQRKLTNLPSPEERAALALLANRILTEASYVPIGIDHYASPEDPLATHVERGFMGYTPRARPVVGFGPSAISAVAGVFVQQEPHLGRWLKNASGFPVHRFHRSTADELTRASLISDILTGLRAELDWAAFPEARARLEEECSTFVGFEVDGLSVDPEYRLLARNVASAFDPSGGNAGAPSI